MTFEELKAHKEVCEQEEKRYDKLKWEEWKRFMEKEQEYIDERLPFPFKKRQFVEIVLEVTEKTREQLTEEYRKKRAYKLGRRYKKEGKLIYYIVGDEGELRPVFWGGSESSYSRTDKIISIEETVQFEERCGECWHFRKGACYMSGGEKPTQECESDSYICGYFCRKRNEDRQSNQ